MDDLIGVYMEVLEEDVAINYDMGIMRHDYLDLIDLQEVYGGQTFVNTNVNDCAPFNYIITYQLAEGYRNLLRDPIHVPRGDRENILQSYEIFDSMLPWKKYIL